MFLVQQYCYFWNSNDELCLMEGARKATQIGGKCFRASASLRVSWVSCTRPVGAGLVYYAAGPAQIKARKPLSPTFRSEQLISFFLLANGEEILQKGYWLSHLLQIS